MSSAPFSSIYFSSASIEITSATNISCEPNFIISFTLHSIETGLSFIKGTLTNCAFSLCNFISLNLSNFSPDLTPHQSVAYANCLLVKFITNSPDSLIKLYEYLIGLIDMYTIAGLVFKIPVHATVIILLFSIVPHDTITAGNGYSNVPDFQIFLPIIFSSTY